MVLVKYFTFSLFLAHFDVKIWIMVPLDCIFYLSSSNLTYIADF